MMDRVTPALAIALFALAAAPDTHAQTAPRPRPSASAAPTWRPGTWNPQWRRANWTDYTLGAGALLAHWYVWTHVSGRPVERTWEGGILFDDALRHALAFRDNGTRESLTVASEVTIDVLLGYSLVVDPAIALSRGQGDLAWELAWQGILVQFAHSAFQVAIRHPIGREHPSYYYCARTGENCQSRWAQSWRAVYAGAGRAGRRAPDRVGRCSPTTPRSRVSAATPCSAAWRAGCARWGTRPR
jgi:hypothetical protein